MNNNDEFLCPICGNQTSKYMGKYRKDKLCLSHANQLNLGLIVQCEECNEWHETRTKCNCKKIVYRELPVSGFDRCILCDEYSNGYAFCKNCWSLHRTEQLLDFLNSWSQAAVLANEPSSNKEDETSSEPDELIMHESLVNAIGESNIEEEGVYSVKQTSTKDIILVGGELRNKCIICGEDGKGKLFCPNCYMSFKNKDILIRISRCSTIRFLDEAYVGWYTCKDGHVVKSKSEREIDNYLFDNGIMHGYEKEVSYGPNKDDVLKPDFFLPDYLGKNNHVYIEHWGYGESNTGYMTSKNSKMKIYEQLCESKEMTLICTYEKSDAAKINSSLERKLKKKNIKEYEINYAEEDL